MRAAAILALGLGLLACVSAPLPPLRSMALIELGEGERLRLHRWSREGAPRVLIVNELGFDSELLVPLAARVQQAGFEVLTFDSAPRSVDSARGDVRLALDVSGATLVIAIGVGGALALDVLEQSGVRGALLVNVPLTLEPSNLSLAEALLRFGFQPASWAFDASGPILLGAGRTTSFEASLSFEKHGRRLHDSLARELESLYARRTVLSQPTLPTRLLVGPRDNLAEPRLSMLARTHGAAVAARRMGRIETFTADVGHLDWLADPMLFEDVVPALVKELEALR